MSRIETDLLGSLELPDDALYGIQTARAQRNFRITGRTVRPELIQAFAQVKRACARANRELGFLAPGIADAVMHACDEVFDGLHDAQFVTDALQGGAGTSTNMNVNEVVARRASQILGAPVDALEHVNMHQSTNDAYPTALRIAAMRMLGTLEHAIIILQEAYQAKEREFADVVKLGRTQLRDAVPVTLGREMGACATALSRDRWRIFKCNERLRVTNLGGTAVGTGLTAPRTYIFLVADILREDTGLPLSRAENLIDATQNLDPFVEVSGIIRAHAVNLVKFARDLRLMSSGPHGGLGEIELPALQPGSSIMPGKVNPVIPEMVMQAGFRVMGHDQEIAMVVSAGELELNAFLPLITDALLTEIDLMTQADRALADLCVSGITANVAHCRDLMERSLEIVTALIPAIGHERAVELARTMRDRGISVREAVREAALIGEEELERLLSADVLTALGWK